MEAILHLPMKLYLLPIFLSALGAAANTCNSGLHQSPIDITAAVVKQQILPALNFDYHSVPLRLANDGHTVRVRFGKGQQLLIGKQSYSLQQFHFHTPGGDRIAGEEFPMAAHILHKSASGQLLAVVVLFRLGAENPVLTTLLPLIPPQRDGDHSPAKANIDATALLPANKAYFRYTGSETAPPCTEGVEWIVLKQPVQLSAAQLADYRKRFADNARVVQPLNGRTVQESQ
jgi:carbonic anhydrase